MNIKQNATMLISILSLSTFAFAATENTQILNQTIKTKPNHNIVYSTGGHAEVLIDRSVEQSFKILTDVNKWPDINVGVTQAVTPAKVMVKKGAVFNETIASPIPGIKSWTNQWTIAEYEPNKKFVITGIEQFASVPIYSKITYEFEKKGKNKTQFEREIEVSLDENFVKNAKIHEVEALYRFLGSQWEMTHHLKHYIEKNTPAK